MVSFANILRLRFSINGNCSASQSGNLSRIGLMCRCCRGGPPPPPNPQPRPPHPWPLTQPHPLTLAAFALSQRIFPYFRKRPDNEPNDTSCGLSSHVSQTPRMLQRKFQKNSWQQCSEQLVQCSGFCVGFVVQDIGSKSGHKNFGSWSPATSVFVVTSNLICEQVWKCVSKLSPGQSRSWCGALWVRMNSSAESTLLPVDAWCAHPRKSAFVDVKCQ